MEDRADVGLPVRAGIAQRVPVQGLVPDNGLDAGGPGDLVDGFGIVGVLGEDRHGAGVRDGLGGLVDLLGGGVLLGVEVGQGGALEGHAVGGGEVAEGVVTGEQDALVGRDGLQAGAGPGVQVIETVDVALGAGTQELGGLRGGLLQGGTDIGHLDDGVRGRGPHVRVEAELGLALPVLGREGPGGDVNLGRPAIDGVGQLLLLGQLGVEVVDVGGAGDPGGHDHGALEAGGGDGVVEEVLQVDAGDEEEIGLGQRPGLLRGHVVLVGGGIGGEQAGQGQVRLGAGGVGAEVLGGAVGAGAVEGQAVVLAVGG